MLTSFLSAGPDPAAMACNIKTVPTKPRRVTRANSTPDLLGDSSGAVRKRSNRRKKGVERTASGSSRRSSGGSGLGRTSSERGLAKSGSGRSLALNGSLRDIRDSLGNGSNNSSKNHSSPLRSSSRGAPTRAGSSSNLLELGMEAVGAVGAVGMGAVEAVGGAVGAVGAVGIGVVEGAVGVVQDTLEVAGVVDNGPTMEDHMTEMEDFLRVVKSSKKEDRNKILTEAILAQAEAGKKAKRAS